MTYFAILEVSFPEEALQYAFTNLFNQSVFIEWLLYARHILEYNEIFITQILFRTINTIVIPVITEGDEY
jgi:hypothetical protein